MSRQRQVQIKDLAIEHREIEEGQASPYLTAMESYYVSHSQGFAGKIAMATWIPSSTRKHMIDHVRLMLNAKVKQRKKIQTIAFRRFAKDPVIKKAETSSFRYGKRKDGTLFKQKKSNGQFAKFSQKERGVISKR